MERADTIMERLGFKKEADDSVKAAFVKNLIKQAYGVEVEVPPQYELKARETQENWMEQTVASVSNFESRLQAGAQAGTQNGTGSAQQLSFELEYSAPKVG